MSRCRTEDRTSGFKLDTEMQLAIVVIMANWFVAFRVNPDGWYERVIHKLPKDTRVFHPEDIHLTVAFLGDLTPPRVPIVIDTLKILECSPVTLHAEKLIALPSHRHFSAICLDFTNHHPAFESRMEIWKKEIFAAAEVQPDSRKFLAHATICRPLRKLSFDKKKQILEEIMSIDKMGIEIIVDTVAFYTWADDRGVSRDNRQFKTVFERTFH